MSKVCVLVSPAHPLRGGIAASSERLAQEFQAAGYKVVLFSFYLQYPSFLFPGKTQWTADAPPDGLEIRSTISSINPWSWWKTAKAIQKLQPDLIIARYWLPFMAPSIGSILRWSGKNVKKIGLVDNYHPHESRVGDKWFTRYFTNTCNGFVTMSTAVKAEMEAEIKDKVIRYCAHPLYDHYGRIIPKKDARALLNIPEEERVVLFFGFIREYKGLDLMLESISMLKQRGFIVKGLVAGEYYGNESRYQGLIDSLGIHDLLYLHTDFIPNDEVQRYFCACDLVVQPYRSATQSGVAQIAFHFNKPVLVTDIGGLPEIIEDGENGYVVPVNPSAIADKIALFFMEDKADAFAEKVKVLKSRYSWSALVTTFASFLKR